MNTCPDCGKDFADDVVFKRDADEVMRGRVHGQIKHTCMTSERAAELAQSKPEATKRERKASAKELADSLKEVVLGDSALDTSRREAISNLIDNLAVIAVSQNAKALTAIQEALKLVGSQETNLRRPAKGEQCELCGSVYKPTLDMFNVSDAGRRVLLDTLKKEWGIA